MEHFGEYITNEYAILKQILNNLSLKDLLTARKVCKGWHKCATHIMCNGNRRPHLLYTDELFHDIELEHWDDLRSVPDIMIRFSSQEPLEPDQDARNQCWASLIASADGDGNADEGDEEEIIKKHDIECGLLAPTALLDFSCDGTIGFVPKHGMLKRSLNYSSKVQRCKFLYGFDHTLTRFEKQYVFTLASSGKSSSAVILPRMPGVHYDVVKFYVENKEICFETFPKTSRSSDKPVKCIFLLDCRFRNTQIIKALRILMDHFKISDNTCFALGGGRLKGAKMWPKGNKANVRAHMYAIVIRGENVTADSFMLKPQYYEANDVDAQISMFAKKVGPLARGSSRMAVMAQCVDRLHFEAGISSCCFNENSEAKIIAKHFPNVPLFGFVAKGELGYCSDFDTNEPPAKRLKSKPSLYINYQSTSLLILTFKTSS